MALPDTVAAIARGLAAGDFSSREITEHCLKRIAEVDKTLQAFSVLCTDKARADADAADTRRKRGTSIGPLDGVPYCAKDLYDTAGVETTSSSKTLKATFPRRTPAPLPGCAGRDRCCWARRIRMSLPAARPRRPPATLEPGPRPGWLQRGHRCGCRGWRGALGPGHGLRRLHPYPVLLERPERPEADVWARAQGWRGGAFVVHGPHGAVVSHRRRCGDGHERAGGIHRP